MKANVRSSAIKLHLDPDIQHPAVHLSTANFLEHAMHMGVADDAVTAHRSDEPDCVVVGVRIEPVDCSLVLAGQCSHSWLKVMSNVDQS